METQTLAASPHPGDDFDEYVNGEWKLNTEIPADQSRWGSFLILRDENLGRLRKICESDTGLVGQLYTQLMEDGQKSEIVQQLVQRAESITNYREYLALAGELFRQNITTLVHICKTADDKDPDTYVPRVFQSGLGLPDMSYYTEREDVHEDYLAYVQFACQHYGHTPDTAALLQFEKDIAAHHLTRVQQRDPKATYNKLEYTQVRGWLPEYFDALQMPEMSHIIVSNPKHLEYLSTYLPTVDIATLRSHLVFRIVHNFADVDTDELLNAMFSFYGQKLNGQPELRAKWKRCIDRMNDLVGDELGKLYVAQYFPEDKQKLCSEMVNNLIDVLSTTLDQQTWMSEATRAEAQRKLSNLGVNKVGAPSKYHSIEGLWTDEEGNRALPATVVETLQQWGQWDWSHEECRLFNTPVDKELWGMTPHTVNAYYHPTMSEIVFPAGILQAPFFGGTVEENLGGIGVVIGHEMTHGFDDQGRQYDADGELRDWWTEQDSEEFNRRTKPVEEHYSSKVVCGEHVNGKLTLGENIADIGGLKIALRALRQHYGDHLTRDHLATFFRSYARVWGFLVREEYAKKLLTIDPHSPATCRINAALAHVPEFYSTFEVTSEHKLYLAPEKRMSIW